MSAKPKEPQLPPPSLTKPNEPDLSPKPSTAQPKRPIPPRATVESLLSDGFVPPLSAIGSELQSASDAVVFFNALPLHDKKEILRAYLQGSTDQNHLVDDADRTTFFNVGSTKQTHVSGTCSIPDLNDQPDASASTLRPKTARFQTTVEDADSDSDDVTARLGDDPKGKQRSNEPTGTAPSFPARPSATFTPRPMPSSGGSNHFNVCLLDAVHDIQEKVDRRLADLQTSIQHIQHKLSESLAPEMPERRTPRSVPKKARNRSTAARIQKANAGEDFTEQLEAVTSDEEGGTPAPATSKTPKPASTPQARAQFNEAVERAHLKRLGTCVRIHLDEEILDIKNVKELPGKFPVLTELQIKAYTDSKEPVITSRETFFMDFSRPLKSFVLNKMAADFFIEDFLAAVAGGSYQDPPIPARYLTKVQIFAALEGHVDHLRSEFSRLTKAATPENIQKQKDREALAAAASRQRNTLHARRDTVTDPAFGLQRHAAIVSKLRWVHISPDVPVHVEKGVRCRVFHITEVMWQSRKYKDFMRGLDKIRGSSKQGKGGNLPRQRIELADPQWVDTPAPVGLWKNCYDDDWLGKQTLYTLNSLQIIDEDYDFSLDQRMEEFA